MPHAKTDQSKPKVAVVYHFFAHYRAAVMQELLDSDQYEFHLAGDREGRRQQQIKAWTDIPEHRFINLPCLWLKGPVIWQRGLIRLALRRDFEAIIYLGNAYWPTTWISSIIARLLGKKVYFWTIGWIGPDFGLKRRLRNIFYSIPHGLLLYGHAAKLIGLKEGFTPEYMHVIYNSLDHKQQVALRTTLTRDGARQVRNELFEHPDRPLLICTTRLFRKRRLDLVLQAMVLLRERGHDVNLLLVGEGPEHEPLETFAKEHDLAVHFYGACYDEPTLARLIAAANATVAPGMVGLASMHSLVYGTPVITVNSPDEQAPEWESLIPGVTGGVFDKENVEQLADVIQEWTATPYPDDSIRHQCYEIIDRFWNPVVQRIIIERALDGHPADDLFWLKESLPTDCPIHTDGTRP